MYGKTAMLKIKKIEFKNPQIVEYIKVSNITPINMSRTVTSSERRTKFCRWCYNANLPESVYTSHYVRESQDPDSDIVCRNLLKHRCSACNCYGHSRGNCAVVDTTSDRRPEPVPQISRHKHDAYWELTRRNVYIDEQGWRKWVCSYTGEVMCAPPLPDTMRQTNMSSVVPT